jgi:hypothetical protein
MALRVSTRSTQVIRFVFDVAANGGLDVAINRTLAISNVSAVFSTSAAAKVLNVQKTAAVCAQITTTNTPNENLQAGTLDLANAYFVSGDTMRFITDDATLRGIAYVTVLPGIVSSS